MRTNPFNKAIASRIAMVAPEKPPELAARRLLSIDETAHALHISGRFLRDLISRGTIHAVRIGRRVLVPRDELERVVREGAP